MTRPRSALERVECFLACFTEGDDEQRFAATALDATFRKPRLVKFTVADLREVTRLARRLEAAARELSEMRELLAMLATPPWSPTKFVALSERAPVSTAKRGRKRATSGGHR